MEFINESGFQAGWTLGFEPDGRELLIVVVKATYRISEAEELELAKEQVPLTKSDEFTGEPGLSAPLHETDFAPRKLHCDVLLNGSAYAPAGEPVDRVGVGLRIGSIQKSFYVFGDRHWEGLFAPGPTEPALFTQLPISYDRAYGGVDVDPDNSAKIESYHQNPIGVGYHPIRRKALLDGKPLPNTAEDDSPVENTNGHFRPMSYGPVGRNFYPRHTYTGTYDQQWLDSRAPFWPDDFNYLYFQAAPEDQQVPYLAGGESVILVNLTPDGVRRFRVPKQPMPITFLPYNGSDIRADGVCDTLLLEPDQDRVMLTWRVSLPLRRNCFELKEIVVGEMGYSWHSARRAEKAGKVYYRNLAEMAADRKARRRA